MKNKKNVVLLSVIFLGLLVITTAYAQGTRVSQLQMGEYRPEGAWGNERMNLNRSGDWNGTVVHFDNDGVRSNGSWRADGSGADFIITVDGIGTFRARTTGTRSFTMNGIEWVRR